MKRGQLPLEHMILTSLILLFVGVLLYYALGYAVTNYKTGQVDDALHSIIITAQAVHTLGPGNQENVIVNLPESIQLIVEDTQLSVKIADTFIDQSVSTDFNLVGRIPPFQGLYPINVKAINETLVQIGEWPHLIALSPAAVNFEILPQLISILGEDFTPDMEVLVDGKVYPTTLVTYVDETTIQFLAKPNEFKVLPKKPNYYYITLRNSLGEIFGPLLFTIYGPAS